MSQALPVVSVAVLPGAGGGGVAAVAWPCSVWALAVVAGAVPAAAGSVLSHGGAAPSCRQTGDKQVRQSAASRSIIVHSSGTPSKVVQHMWLRLTAVGARNGSEVWQCQIDNVVWLQHWRC